MSGETKATSGATLSTQELVIKLKQAFSQAGDFPACAKIVMQIRELVTAGDASAQQITTLVLQEPSLGMRILGLVNSSLMQRGKPIVSVSQAIVHIGMHQLAEMCASLVLLQKLVPAARQGGPFATSLRNMLMTAILASSISKATSTNDNRKEEFGYLMGSFSEIGPLLLSYYYPPLYDSILKRTSSKGISLAKAFFEITGIRPTLLSLEVTGPLSLPALYKNALVGSEAVGDPGKRAALIGSKLTSEIAEAQRYAKVIYSARALAESITLNTPKEKISGLIDEVCQATELTRPLLVGCLAKLSGEFRAMCELMEITLPLIPDFIATLDSAGVPEEQAASDALPKWLTEIKAAVESREPTVTVITEVMEHLAWDLKFDRVLLLLANPAKTALLGRMAVGAPLDTDPKKIVRPLGKSATPDAVDAQAFAQQVPVVAGSALSTDAKAAIAIPIGLGSRTVGVIYADKVGDGAGEADIRVLNAVSSILDRCIEVNG